MHKQLEATPEPVRFDLKAPFSTFKDGKPAIIPFSVKGLLTAGGMSLLAGKPKQGKSSLSRHLAQCVSQGAPFLGRDTEKGQVLLISLEDPESHTDNHLKVLEHDPDQDSRIFIASRVKTAEENLEAIENALKDNPGIKLVIIDTLQKLVQCEDMNDFSKVGPKVSKLHELAKQYHVHIIGLVHCKKAQQGDQFDSMLGSTAFRAEADTNIIMFEGNDGRRYIAAETRIGKAIPSTVLEANLVQLDADNPADYIRDYHLGETMEGLKAEVAAKADRKKKMSIEDAMVALVTEKGSATHKELNELTGKASAKVDAIKRLVGEGVLVVSGQAKSSKNPLTYSINQDRIQTWQFGRQFAAEDVYDAGMDVDPEPEVEDAA